METVPFLRTDFPILAEKINDKRLVYLDNAATTQKPRCVLDTINEYYSHYNANVHRGVHTLSNICTQSYEAARVAVQKYINAKHKEEVVFVKGATEAINLVASGITSLEEGDVILTTEMEHHSNFVPWQILCRRSKASFKVIPLNEKGELRFDILEQMLDGHVRMLALTYVSNVLGTVNPIEEIIALAHKHQVPVFVDGTQAVQHFQVDVQKLDCDFLCFSSHKMYGPTGVGVLYGKSCWLDKLSPCQYGGEMVDSVGLQESTFQPIPLKFEAGTPDYIGAIALHSAISYLEKADINAIHRYEEYLINYARDRLLRLNGVSLLGNPSHFSSILSFTLTGIQHYDAAVILDKLGIAIRSGNHCAQPLLRRYQLDGTLRVSIAAYNTVEEIDVLCEGIVYVQKFLLSRGKYGN